MKEGNNQIQHTNNEHLNTHSNESSKKVGLSYRPNLTAGIYTKVFINGEGSCRLITKGSNQGKFKPPINQGERICDSISNRAKSRIRLGCRIFQYIAEQAIWKCAMITLTYGKNFPDDKTAKKHLDNFLKRLKRQKGASLYLWVAERQKRGAIHFHILTSFTDKEFINSAWNEIANRWQIRNSYEIQKLYPNVIAVNYPAKYLSKYISKGGQSIKGNLYGISQELSKCLKPIYENTTDINPDHSEIIIDEALKSVKIEHLTNKNGEQKRFIWAMQGIEAIAKKIEQISKSITHD